MTHASSTDNVLHWTLDESRAIFRGDGIQLDVTPHEPHCGGTARLKDDGGTQANAHLFQLRWPWRSEVGSDPVAEAYVRQRDLVITYEQRPPRTVRPQTYWRVFPIDAVHGMALEYVLSLQTDRLASEPRCQVVSEVLGRPEIALAPVERLGNSAERWLPVSSQPEAIPRVPGQCRPCILFRPNRASWSYLEMLYPGDFTEVQVRSAADSDTAQSCWTLFAEDLEKGVIRRARLRGVFLPRENDEGVAEQLWNDFLQSELPLTT
jgi:hypothetical protein